MNQARSIKQNTPPDALPNFRSPGVILRILLICIDLALLQSLLQADAWREVPQQMMQITTQLTPALLFSLLALWLIHPRLAGLRYLHGALATTVLVSGLALLSYLLGGELYRAPEGSGSGFGATRHMLLACAVSVLLLMYFRWRDQTLSLALHDARLQVLRARIRPHFLFNTLNAVLSIVRTQPKRAETALEDLSDLFRMAMDERNDLVPLHREIRLCRAYLALEQLRIGDRLQVMWRIEDLPESALIPPLLLQPLLENAVYHGIEPMPQGGTISIALSRHDNELHLSVHNPCVADTATHPGNLMALRNIRERLALLFDIAARYRVEQQRGSYRVEITLPYRTEQNLESS